MKLASPEDSCLKVKLCFYSLWQPITTPIIYHLFALGEFSLNVFTKAKTSLKQLSKKCGLQWQYRGIGIVFILSFIYIFPRSGLCPIPYPLSSITYLLIYSQYFKLILGCSFSSLYYFSTSLMHHFFSDNRILNYLDIIIFCI